MHTLSLMGWDADAGRHFARTIENHGFTRDYTLTVAGRTWTLTGEHERASHTFSDDGRTCVTQYPDEGGASSGERLRAPFPSPH